MLLEFSIVGGYIKIPKSIFIREMLSRDSRLRTLLNWGTTKGFTLRHPMISEPEIGDIITINFSGASSVVIGESPKDILGELKAKYKEKIEGKVSCRVIYETFGTTFFFDIDLNSNRDKIEYIMN